MISYNGLEKKLKERGMKKSELTDALGISSRTLAKIGRGEKLSHIVLEKLCAFFDCEAADICREVSENVILQTLRDEKRAKLSGGLYHELQVRMTYNSNHIEGSRLTEEQTRLIFETRSVGGEGVLVDDVLETVHHFRAIDLCIDRAEEVLTEDLIKKLHYVLKHDTKDSAIEWFAVGDYKKKPNVVGGRETAKPAEVSEKMRELLAEYNSKVVVSVEDVVAFHAAFEYIHPFQDGNGRVGRLIAFKECLKNNIVPFIIEDRKKAFYYRGLSEWKNDRAYLVDTCLDGQDTFKRLLDMFDISYN